MADLSRNQAAMTRTYARTFEWRFGQPPAALWPALADTARWNEAAGLPKHQIEEIEQPDGSVRFFAEARKGPFRLAWEEIPVEWIDGQWFRHDRIFSAGPLRLLSATLRLESDGAGGAVGHYTLEAAPANLIGWAILKTAFFGSVEKSFTALARGAEEWAAGNRERPFETPPVEFSTAARGRLEGILGRIARSGNDHGLSRRLADWMRLAQEVDLARIRPLALARHWAVDERHAIEMCLQSVRSGLLEMRWDLLCPRCRGAKLTVTALDQLPCGAHCGSCNIAYGRNFARNVELTFHPAPAIREVLDGEFCLFGPMSTPHVKLQIAVNADDQRRVPARLEPGDYRIRTLEAGGEADFTFSGGGFPEAVIDEADVTAGAPAEPGTVRIVNRTGHRRTFIVEARDWVRDTLSAERVTTLQAFRDLFSDQILRAGDQVGISQVTLMFTDLRGSTALYEQIGDAAACHLVREHFTFLAQVIRTHKGSIVKTIGDAVMAAFNDPADAARAALAVQRGVHDFNRTSGGADIVIKLGLHNGHCIAVTLSERLDYFGSAVNLAARLQGESKGGDIVLSRSMLDDPAVAVVLAGHEITDERAEIKGFDDVVAFGRLIPKNRD
ncbi:hypothetical protein JYU08_00365 [bacterium AH-315-B06]|nr:hypothetical protein [bacterium AH-315-B06]